MVEKSTERFLGSSLLCCLHAIVLLAVKYLAELNKYVLLVSVICEKYWFRGHTTFLATLAAREIASPLNRYFSQITLTNKI